MSAPPPAYHPPPPGLQVPPAAYPPAIIPQAAPPQPGTTVIVQSAAPQHQFNQCFTSADPVRCTCPSCHAQIITRVQYVTGTLTWIVFVVLLFVFFILACIPFCCNAVKDACHYCPHCGHLIGTYKRG